MTMTAEITNSAAISFPTTGKGAVTTAYSTDHVSTGSEVYTATTCTATWGAGGAPNDGTAVGDLVVTQDGYWGVFQSGTATVVTVDYWRTILGGRGTPTAGQDCRIYNGKCILAGSRMVWLKRVDFGVSVAGTVGVVDVWGNALWTYTVPASPTGTVLDFTEGGAGPGLMFDRLIGFKASVAGITANFVFST